MNFIEPYFILVSIISIGFLQGCLEYPPVGLWAALELEDILLLLEVIIHTLCVALRLPSNKRFFHSEVCNIRLLISASTDGLPQGIGFNLLL